MALRVRRDGPGARLLLAVVAVAAVAAGVDALGDATQTRPDAVVAGSRTEITLAVRVRTPALTPLGAARALWAVCAGEASSATVEPGVTPAGDHFVVAAEPALGPNAWRRVQGCLEDLTVDGVLGRVVAVAATTPG